MKRGIISLDFRRHSLKFCFQTAASAGYDGVELWGGRPHAWPADILKLKGQDKEILQLKKQYHLEIPMYTPNAIGLPVNLCSPLQEERQEGLAYYLSAVEAAARLQIRRILVVADHPGYETDLEEARKWFAEAVECLMRKAQNYDITISVEPLTPMESPVICSSDDCVRLMHTVSGDNLDFVLDIVPATVMCDPISAYFCKLGSDRIGHVHLCNTSGLTDEHNLPERGILDVRSIEKQLAQLWKYDGYVIYELYSASFRDPATAVMNAMSYLS